MIAAPLILPFAELAGITIAGLGMAAASKKVSDFISANPETSMEILNMIVPGSKGLETLFKKKATISLEDVEDMTDEEAADLSKEDKAEIMKEVGKSKGGDKRQRMIEISEKLGLSGEGKEKQTIIDEVEERYDEGGVEDAPKPKFDYKKFFRNRNADGGAIGIEVLFEEKKDGGRIGFANGGDNIIGADLKDSFFNKLYGQDTIADLEAQYGLGGSGKPSQARHQAAVNELSKNLNIGNFGPGNLFTALGASATEIPDVIRTRDIKESARDIFDNLKGALVTDKSKTPADVYRDIYETPTNQQTGIMQNISDFFFAPAGATDFQGGEMLQAPTSPVRADYERAPNTAFAELLSQNNTNPELTRKFDKSPAPLGMMDRLKQGVGSVFDTVKNFSPTGIIGSLLSNLDRFDTLSAADQDFITSQGLGQDKYGYNKRSAFGNYANLVKERARIAANRRAQGLQQRAIDDYYEKLEKERQAKLQQQIQESIQRESGADSYTSQAMAHESKVGRDSGERMGRI